ncbi:MAG: hypothetical protein BHV88_15065 [Clostridiales bacterium 41_12_two_minus]|nr:MAG: hypothetical protein BHV88_15065 [Clostridiales bacterium 41_12_two_minus]
MLHTFCLPDGEDHAVAAKVQAEFAHYLCAHILSCKGDPFPGYSPLHWKREERRKKMRLDYFYNTEGENFRFY